MLTSEAISGLGRQRISKCVEAIAALWIEGGVPQERASNAPTSGDDVRVLDEASAEVTAHQLAEEVS